ncbi:hypothetical protein STEG23_008323 [Scotinomys teguina]
MRNRHMRIAPRPTSPSGGGADARADAPDVGHVDAGDAPGRSSALASVPQRRAGLRDERVAGGGRADAAAGLWVDPQPAAARAAA